MITSDIKKYIDQSVLCWLATVSEDGQPNVSPKELFTYTDHEHLVVAQIASPQTVKNIKGNPKVAISFVDVLIQKGYQLKGKAEMVNKSDSRFKAFIHFLPPGIADKFPIGSLILIKIEQVKPILAPSYIFYPDTTEQDQIVAAKKKLWDDLAI